MTVLGRIQRKKSHPTQFGWTTKSLTGGEADSEKDVVSEFISRNGHSCIMLHLLTPTTTARDSSSVFSNVISENPTFERKSVRSSTEYLHICG